MDLHLAAGMHMRRFVKSHSFKVEPSDMATQLIKTQVNKLSVLNRQTYYT